jgi:hypothetical protein
LNIWREGPFSPHPDPYYLVIPASEPGSICYPTFAFNGNRSGCSIISMDYPDKL